MVKEIESFFKIVAILNIYKNILNNFNHSSDLKFLNWLGLINKKLYIITRSKKSLTKLLDSFYLEKNISDSLALQMLKIKNFQVNQHHNIAFLISKSGKI